ncbi:MAG: exonuclease SbcCD subunit D [Clostridia bacterium]|nr:exonuclease SbcCD subunit D [Clostridia bacterium]
MKLLHTADLHLDSPFCATDAHSAEARREGQRRVLERIFACASQEKCDMILIAGDLFDSKYVTPETAQLACRLFREAACPVVIAPGNHDPYGNGSFYKNCDLPENVYVFSSTEVQCLEFPELRTRVFGYAFTSPALTVSPLGEAEPPAKEGWTHLLCAHAELSAPMSRYCPLTVGDIARFGIDYAALGHIHNRPQDDSAEGVCIRYSGFAEGRSFDELGEGGVWIVTLEPGEPARLERRVISQQRYCLDEVDLSRCVETAELRSAIRERAAAYETLEGTHLRLFLTGTVEPEQLADLPGMARELQGTLASLELRDLTLPLTDTKALSQDITLRGAFYRALYSQLMDDAPAVRKRAAQALQIGLAAIDNHRIPERRDEQ